MSRENMLGWTVAHPKRPDKKYGRIVAVVKNIYPDGHYGGIHHWIIRLFVEQEQFPTGGLVDAYIVQPWRGP